MSKPIQYTLYNPQSAEILIEIDYIFSIFFCEQNEKQKEERSENILSQPIIFRSIETNTVNKIQQVMNEIYSNNENPSQRKKIKENL